VSGFGFPKKISVSPLFSMFGNPNPDNITVALGGGTRNLFLTCFDRRSRSAKWRHRINYTPIYPLITLGSTGKLLSTPKQSSFLPRFGHRANATKSQPCRRPAATRQRRRGLAARELRQVLNVTPRKSFRAQESRPDEICGAACRIFLCMTPE